MKAIMNHNETPDRFDIKKIQFGNQENSSELEIVDFVKEPESGQFVISLYSELFANNQLKVFIRENKIIIFITEQVNSYKSATIYVSDWQSFYPQSYTRMRNVSLLLPGDNFYLLRHFLISEKYLLKIFLGRLVDN
jgi:hypothetical protein